MLKPVKHPMNLVCSASLLVMITLCAGPVAAQEGEQGAQALSPSARRAQAQQDVEEARKLLKVRRYPEAIKLLEEAWLVLEDPELLRMLALAHRDAGDKAAAQHYLDQYLADPSVGERAKESARRDLAGLSGAQEDEDEEGWGLSGWQSGGAQVGRSGQLFANFSGRITHNPGAEFEQGQWNHSGVGVAVEGGAFVSDGLGLGLSLGLDRMTWATLAPQDEFKIIGSVGLRPSMDLNLRYYLGGGFHVGGSAGGDLVIFGARPKTTCVNLSPCPDSGEGLQGSRLLYGALFGYRAELTPGWSIGVDAALRHVPLLIARSGSAAQGLPSYTEGGWMLNLGAAVQWEE